MNVTPSDIGEQFDLLISGQRSREDVEAWAEARQRAEDARELVYMPPGEEDRLWDAIKYLLGVALKTIPDGYLHSVEDFETYRRTAGF